MSEPATQPATATGNGTGYYVDNGWLGAISGTIQAALNYAIVRDQQAIAQKNSIATGVAATNASLATAQANAKIENSRFVMLGLIAVGVMFAMKGK